MRPETPHFQTASPPAGARPGGAPQRISVVRGLDPVSNAHMRDRGSQTARFPRYCSAVPSNEPESVKAPSVAGGG